MSHIHHSISTTPFPSKTTKFHHHFSTSRLQLYSAKLRKTNKYTDNNNNTTTTRGVKVVVHATSSENLAPLVEKTDDRSQSLVSGSEVVRKFYAGINSHDLSSVENLIAVNCVYEDLVFPRPFLGRKSILEFFGKFIDQISTDLQFVIDAISEEDSSAVGVTWHLEWKGKAFPFSKGCSFYQLVVVDGTRQIIYARDSVEPAIKPGESALVAIRGVTWLLQRFPNLVDRF